jgi:hypothetical protein
LLAADGDLLEQFDTALTRYTTSPPCPTGQSLCVLSERGWQSAPYSFLAGRAILTLPVPTELVPRKQPIVLPLGSQSGIDPTGCVTIIDLVTGDVTLIDVATLLVHDVDGLTLQMPSSGSA